MHAIEQEIERKFYVVTLMFDGTTELGVFLMIKLGLMYSICTGYVLERDKSNPQVCVHQQYAFYVTHLFHLPFHDSNDVVKFVAGY